MKWCLFLKNDINFFLHMNKSLKCYESRLLCNKRKIRRKTCSHDQTSAKIFCGITLDFYLSNRVWHSFSRTVLGKLNNDLYSSSVPIVSEVVYISKPPQTLSWSHHPELIFSWCSYPVPFSMLFISCKGIGKG